MRETPLSIRRGTRKARGVGFDKAEAHGSDGHVAQWGLLAAGMPSLLTRLRPMDRSSAGMLAYLFRPADRGRARGITRV